MSEWTTSEGDHWATNADRYTRMLSRYGEILADAADFGDGGRVLDVGCGCGDVSLAAARVVGAQGAVQGVDLSPAMLAVASTRATEAGLSNIDFVTADAATYQTEPAAFDSVVSRFGVMFFDAPIDAFANIHALMIPGAQLSFVCWQDLFSNDWMIVPGAAVAEVLPLPVGDDPTAPGPFAFADPDRINTTLTAAGFDSPTVTGIKAKMWMGENALTAAAFLRTTGLGRAVFAGADATLVEEAMARATAALMPYETASGVELDGAAWLVTASA